jgi:hypothetical protein
MNRNRSLSIIFLLLLIGLFAWSPWLTASFTKTRAVDLFNKAWESVADGCGTNCNGCGALSVRRVPFGALVTVEYACGLIPEDSTQYHERAEVFISVFGTAHGFPHP